MTNTQADSTKVALINNNIAYIQKDIAEIKSSIKELAGVYVTREALIEVAKQTEERFKILEVAIVEIRKTNKFWLWFGPTLSGFICLLLGGTFMFLITNYLQNTK